MDRFVDIRATSPGFLSCLCVLLNAYVLNGVDGWCTKQLADDYFDLVEQKVWHSKSPGLQVVRDGELQRRLRWLDLVRGPENLDLDKAIVKTMYELAGFDSLGLKALALYQSQYVKRRTNLVRKR